MVVVVLTLSEITDGPISPETEQFVVVFTGPRGLVLDEGLQAQALPETKQRKEHGRYDTNGLIRRQGADRDCRESHGEQRGD